MSSDKGQTELRVAIGRRIGEERRRVWSMNQVDFAAFMGVGEVTQRNYENARTLPDAAYLAAMELGGADVMYILTGRRSDEAAAIDPEEAVLVALFRGLDAKGRELALSLMRGYQAPTKNVSISISGGVSQMVQADRVDQSNAKITLSKPAKKKG